MTDGRKRRTRDARYNQEVHEQAFALWYKAGKPTYRELRQMLVDLYGDGRVPTAPSIMNWRTEDHWDEHADALDGQIEVVQDKEIIQQRQDIIKHMADVGKELVDMGMDYLKKEGIENSADAIRAIGKGMELQDKLLGWAAVFAKLSAASDEDLDKELKKYMTGEVLEATATDADEPTNDTERPE
jgi:hypothetical protein